MSSEPGDGISIPPGAAFVASASGREYFWVGNAEWHLIPPLERLWFATEEAARQAGYVPSETNFEHLEEFELLGELGRGGSSIVYHARDRGLGREVAIKVIQAWFQNDPESLARFAQEVRLLAGLRHPNIVSAFSVKQLPGGGLALVMEYINGPTLRDVVAEGRPLPIDRAESILSDIGAALSAAHRNGVIHRDVKPDNVFLEDATGRALLADFGIAMHLDRPSGLTMVGTAVGTPNYMSPEQIDGGALDGRSDLYSLGLIGWEMLTGSKPWDGESLYSVIYKQKHEELASLRAMRPDVPTRLVYAIEGALAKDPGSRWANVDEFLAYLADGTLPERWHRGPPMPLATQRGAHPADVGAGAPSEQAATVVFRRDQVAEPATPLGPVSAIPPVRRTGVRRAEQGKKLRRAAAIGLLAVGAVGAVVAGVRFPSLIPEVGALDLIPDLMHVDGATLEGPARGLASLPRGDGGDGATAEDRQPGRGLMGGLLDEVRSLGGVGQGDSIDQALNLPLAENDSLPLAEGDSSLADLISPDSLVEDAESNEEEDAVVGEEEEAEADDDEPEFSPLPIDRSRSRVAAGGMHTCGIGPNGGLVCWGGNDSGQLGGSGSPSAEPTVVSAVENVMAVEAGAFHTCALDAAGNAYCWGENRDGQLGERTGDPRAPAPLAGERFYALTLGTGHTCGIAADGQAYCWGSNAAGQLGDGTRVSRETPMRVWTPDALVLVAAGWNHTCGLTSAGRTFCWGRNVSGQLGDGTTEDRSVPAQVEGAPRFRSLTAGSAHTCGLTSEGEAHCWGQNSDGRLGDGTLTDRHRPARVTGGQRFTEISAGGRHTCGLTADGTAYCWGYNNYGQLGTGNTENRSAPTRIWTDIRFTSIRSSGSHTCGVAMDGTTFCWGYNIEGQVGDGTRTHRTVPYPVSRPQAG